MCTYMVVIAFAVFVIIATRAKEALKPQSFVFFPLPTMHFLSYAEAAHLIHSCNLPLPTGSCGQIFLFFDKSQRKKNIIYNLMSID